ncbi:hypothetical protein JCM3263A_10670 [Thermobifida fusca]
MNCIDSGRFGPVHAVRMVPPAAAPRPLGPPPRPHTAAALPRRTALAIDSTRSQAPGYAPQQRPRPGRAPWPESAVPPARHYFRMPESDFYTSKARGAVCAARALHKPFSLEAATALPYHATRAPCPQMAARIPQNKGPENSCGRQRSRSRRWELTSYDHVTDSDR